MPGFLAVALLTRCLGPSPNWVLWMAFVNGYWTKLQACKQRVYVRMKPGAPIAFLEYST